MDPPLCKVGVELALEYLHTPTQAMLTFWLLTTSCKLLLLSRLDTFGPMRVMAGPMRVEDSDGSWNCLLRVELAFEEKGTDTGRLPITVTTGPAGRR